MFIRFKNIFFRTDKITKIRFWECDDVCWMSILTEDDIALAVCCEWDQEFWMNEVEAHLEGRRGAVLDLSLFPTTKELLEKEKTY